MASSSKKSVATDSMPDFAGKVLDAGRLRLIECLGTGAYGKVYSAIDATKRRDHAAQYAVKCLRVPKPQSTEHKLQLREFTNHLAVSSHPNIVTFHHLLRDDADSDDPKFRYVVLDLCTGGDLFEAIMERSFYLGRTDRIKTSFLQLIDAISFCHQNNVYHRDIKPENVLCSKDGSQVFIADFGLSTQSPMCRDLCGSTEYMSVDCIGEDFGFQNKSYSTRCNDIWALGVVFINMITQRSPWSKATARDPCFTAFLEDPDYFMRVLPISVGVNSILKRILHIDPLRRISLSDLRSEVMALQDCFNSSPDSHNSPCSSPTLCRSYSSSLLSVDIGALYIDGDGEQVSNPLSAAAAARSFSSVASSLGPITPETFPVNVETEVPDIDEEEDLGLAKLPLDLVKPGKSVVGRKPFFQRFMYKGKV